MNGRYLFALAALAAAALAATEGVAPGPIQFTDIAAAAGIDFASNSSPTPNKNQPETMVAGVGIFDYDNDGDMDIYYVNGAQIPTLEKLDARWHNRLYRNDGNGKFTDVTEKAGLAGKGYGMGAAAADYDNDGWTDLYVANVTDNQLFRNRGDGTFEDVTAKAGVAGGMLNGRKMWSVAAGWFDYDRDGHLDLFLSNYCKWEVNKDPVCLSGGRLRAYCHPNLYESLPNTLYRNNGNGTFTDVSAETGIAKHAGKGMGVVFNDYDQDGWLDVFIANDNTQNFLFHNLGGKKFEEVALNAGVAYTETGKAVSGMGAEFRDLDNDGLPDIWHTAIEMETFPLFRNRGKGIFIDITGRSGIARQTMQMSGWSNAVADFDNDGWKDLFVARSNVLDNVAEFTTRTYEEPNGLIRNLGKTWKNVGPEAGDDFQKPGAHRGAAIGDIDNDGRIDIVLSVLNGKAKLFRNTSPGQNNWIAFRLTGTKSNRSGIGAQIKVTAEDNTTQYNIATTSTGYAASSDPRVHFGLGASKTAKEVEIRWPSGAVQTLTNVAGNKVVDVTEPK